VSDKRVFIAIDISEQAREAAKLHIDDLRKAAVDVRVGWERPEKLHLTLKFLGNIDDLRINALVEQLSDLASKVQPFTVELIGAGCFPNARQPRILWIGTRDNGEMASLAESVERCCQSLGFLPENRRFTAHLTVARIREPQKGQQLAALHMERGFESVAFEVRELVIYESKLTPKGSRYTRLSQHSLTAI